MSAADSAHHRSACIAISLYSAVSSQLDRSKRFTLFASPVRPVHSDTNSASPQLRANAKSLTCPPLSIARYPFIQLSEQGRQWRERKWQIFETVAKGDSNPGSLDVINESHNIYWHWKQMYTVMQGVNENIV